MKSLVPNLDELLKANPFISKMEIETKLKGYSFNATSITAHSSLCRPGSIFVAHKGATKNSQDGHDFIDHAIGFGASLVIADQDYVSKKKLVVPLIIARDSKKALCFLAEQFYGNPSAEIKVIGITGTNGKTSTSFMLFSILRAAGFTPQIMGTLGMGDPSLLIPLPNTTMDPVFISQNLRAMANQGVTHAILEISSHALSLYRVEAINFDTVALTNFTADHLDFHANLLAYREAKARLFFELASSSTKIVLPIGHPFIDIERATFFGIDLPNGVSYTDVQSSPRGVEFNLHLKGVSIPIHLPLFGNFQAANASLAASIAVGFGIAPDCIIEGLSHCPKIPGRMEAVPNSAHRSVFVDFAHTPDALANLLTSLRPMKSGKVILVFGCGGERDQQKRPQMGKIAEDLADSIILTDDNPRREPPSEIRQQILVGIKDTSKVKEIPNRSDAIRHAITVSQRNDLVVIAGKGHESYQDYGDFKIPFSDLLEAKKVLDAL